MVHLQRERHDRSGAGALKVGRPLGFFLALLAVVVTWALAIPRFASPDEPAHVYKAYGTAHGELLGEPAPGFPNNLREFDGPDSLGPPNLQCYNGQPDVPASCATSIDPHLISSSARYPPWYYGLVGLPARVVGQSDSVFAYRWFSLLLCVALLTLAMVAVKRSARAELAALVVVGVTPMALFLLASVNPNAAEIAGFVAIWGCLTRVLTDDAVPERWLTAAAWLAAALVLMRPIAAAWLIGVAAVAFVAAHPDRRRRLVTWRRALTTTAPIVGALLASWAWLLYARIEVRDQRLDTSLSLGSALRLSVTNWPTYMRQAIGVLGWLDTSLPSFVYVAWAAALLIVAIVHLRGADRRGLAALGLLVVVWLALPLAINVFTYSRAGLTYQGRYSLPILAGLVFLPLWNRSPRLRWPRLSQRPLVAVVLGLVVVAEVAALWQMLRRFTVGAHGKIILAGSLPWQPPVAPMVLVAVNAAAMIAVAWSGWIPWGHVEAAAGERDGEGAQHRHG